MYAGAVSSLKELWEWFCGSQFVNNNHKDKLGAEDGGSLLVADIAEANKNSHCTQGCVKRVEGTDMTHSTLSVNWSRPSNLVLSFLFLCLCLHDTCIFWAFACVESQCEILTWRHSRICSSAAKFTNHAVCRCTGGRPGGCVTVILRKKKTVSTRNKKCSRVWFRKSTFCKNYKRCIYDTQLHPERGPSYGYLGVWCTTSLPLLSGLLCPEVVVPALVLFMSQIDV